MKPIDFHITQQQLHNLIRNAKDGKNSDIGNLAVQVVKLYFLQKDPACTFIVGKRNQPDIIVISRGKATEYEVKGTQSESLKFDQLKVSGNYSYKKLVSGMELIRVTNIRKTNMKIYFLKYGVHFTMKPEPRWAIKEIRSGKSKTIKR